MQIRGGSEITEVWGWGTSVYRGGLRGVLTEEQMLIVFSGDDSHMNKNASLSERGDKIKTQAVGRVCSLR